MFMREAGVGPAGKLEAGGSTTFAKTAEGSDEITVTNRPSDGYERSVSSSLMVVSTAKPSNVFDHAVIAADYDYLTVGTELEMRVSGVTATGGAIALPEGYEAHIVPRSSTFKNYGILQTNSMGVVDYTYRGDGDQWRMPAYATRDVTIEKNARICQFRIVQNQPRLTFTRVEHLDGPDRGGFGSTGK